jgi:hypothetical protein
MGMMTGKGMPTWRVSIALRGREVRVTRGRRFMICNEDRWAGVVLLAGLCAALMPPAMGRAAPLDVRKISGLADMPATITADGVVRIVWPRDDVKVKVDGMPLKPFAGLTSWAAFSPTGLGAMTLGDTVVFEDEVDAAMDAAFAAGLHVTALYSAFFHDEPHVYSMHIAGVGSADKLVTGVKNVWDAIKVVRASRPQPAKTFEGPTPVPGRVDTKSIERIIGHKSEMQDGVVKVTISRDGMMRGTKITATMGVASWVAFSGDDRLAAADGAFILTADEVQPVLRSLRESGIHIVALTNHMIGEQPEFYFAHFWGKGPCDDLAKAFAAALKAQKDASRPGAVR